MIQSFRSVFLLSLALIGLLVFYALPGVAQAAPDFATVRCDLTLEVKHSGTPLTGGSYALYKVGEVNAKNNKPIYKATGIYKQSAVSLSRLDEETANAVADVVRQKKVKATAAASIAKGRVEFTGLFSGVYLVVQDKATPGYQRAKPFLVALPYFDDKTSNWASQLKAEPKIGKQPHPTPGGDGGSTTTPDKPGSDKKDPGKKDPDKKDPDKKGPDKKEPDKKDDSSDPSQPTPGKDDPDDSTKPDDSDDKKDSDDPAKPTDPSQPTFTPSSGHTPSGGGTMGGGSKTLPQTGQLNWPVPVLALVGVIFFAFGWWLTNIRRRQSDEG